mmetsp:Transcript_14183/g.21440  ORF Transcript_14183/g.21440 Transcript_14183/m.21440 type:complete len:86 (-) Transcript_14183:81-338(-)
MWKQLASSMIQLSSFDTDIILAQEFRGGKDMEFWDWIKPYFDYSRVPNDDLDDIWQSDDIGIFHFKKRKDHPSLDSLCKEIDDSS